MLAGRLAGKVVSEPGLPLKAVRVAKSDLAKEDGGKQPEIGFYLKLTCGPKEAFEWLERLSARQYEIDRTLPEKDRLLFARTFAIGPQWEQPK
jgi:hypothetical protein